MKVYDYSKLYGRIREFGYTQESLAEQLGISATSLNLSLNNKRDFRQGEIADLGNLLDIPLNQYVDYFFATKL